jgi:hypothetical protein
MGKPRDNLRRICHPLAEPIHGNLLRANGLWHVTTPRGDKPDYGGSIALARRPVGRYLGTWSLRPRLGAEHIRFGGAECEAADLPHTPPPKPKTGGAVATLACMRPSRIARPTQGRPPGEAVHGAWVNVAAPSAATG